MLGFL